MKNVIIVTVVIVIILIFLRVGYLISPGGYPESENYIINTSQMSLLYKIDSIKSHNTRYNLSSLGNQYDSLKHSYNIYIYNYDRNQIIHIEALSKDNNKSIVHLIGINQGLILGNWKMVNKDLNSSESELVFKNFELIILNHLGVNYKRE